MCAPLRAREHDQDCASLAARSRRRPLGLRRWLTLEQLRCCLGLDATAWALRVLVTQSGQPSRRLMLRAQAIRVQRVCRTQLANESDVHSEPGEASRLAGVSVRARAPDV